MKGLLDLKSFFITVLIASLSWGQLNPANRKIVGKDDFRMVNSQATNIPFKYKLVPEAIGLISMGCTGTHLGQGVVLTAGHCFDAAKVKFNKSCEGVQVFWGVREGKNPTSVSTCKKLLVIEDTKNKDYALFIVDKPPRISLPIRLNSKPELSTRVTIFSHPFKQPLMWSGVCEIRKSFAARYSNSTDTGYLQMSLGLIHHQCDTNPGSSGAAILDAETAEVIGIHNGGVSEGPTGYNYGTYITSTYIPEILKRIGYIFPK